MTPLSTSNLFGVMWYTVDIMEEVKTATEVQGSDGAYVTEQQRLMNLRAEVDILWTVSELARGNSVPLPEIAEKLKSIAGRL